MQLSGFVYLDVIIFFSYLFVNDMSLKPNIVTDVCIYNNRGNAVFLVQKPWFTVVVPSGARL